jgi:hypothetical protein
MTEPVIIVSEILPFLGVILNWRCSLGKDIFQIWITPNSTRREEDAKLYAKRYPLGIL